MGYSKGVYKPKMPHFVALKEAVFPFNKLYGSDLILGPEMKSTGEVMGIARSLGLAFSRLKRLALTPLKTRGLFLFLLKIRIKKEACVLMKRLVQLGFGVRYKKARIKRWKKRGGVFESA